jgi:hypothetical protein
MATLGPIVWDLTARTMAFQQEGHDICWRGVATPSPAGVHSVVSTASLLDGLLGSFPDVFVEPTGLPPLRSRDHRIIVKAGAPPVAVRPYRYPTAGHHPPQRLLILLPSPPSQEARWVVAVLRRLSRSERAHD